MLILKQRSQIFLLKQVFSFKFVYICQEFPIGNTINTGNLIMERLFI